MDLTDAIQQVIADTHEFDYPTQRPGHEIIADIRALGHEEIASWVHQALLDLRRAGAYHTVIDATDAEITRALPE